MEIYNLPTLFSQSAACRVDKGLRANAMSCRNDGCIRVAGKRRPSLLSGFNPVQVHLAEQNWGEVRRRVAASTLTHYGHLRTNVGNASISMMES